MAGKIRQLYPDQAQAAPKSTRTVPRSRRVHRRRLVLLLMTLLLIVGVGTYRLVSTHRAIATQTVQVKKVKRQLAATKAEKEALTIQVNQLQDPVYLAKLVRARYFMSKAGELIFALPPAADSGR